MKDRTHNACVLLSIDVIGVVVEQHWNDYPCTRREK